MIEASNLTKRYGSTVAVSDLSFTIRPGVVTGFLGPNGAGKTTTMRLILGLDNPTAGTVTVNGTSHAQLPSPMHEVGALLDANAVHGGRSAPDTIKRTPFSVKAPSSAAKSVIASAARPGVRAGPSHSGAQGRRQVREGLMRGSRASGRRHAR